jgi:hypothetical protein
MEDAYKPDGEFHHFQLAQANADMPFNISVLFHISGPKSSDLPPISTNDILAFHQAYQSFDGDFSGAFTS